MKPILCMLFILISYCAKSQIVNRFLQFGIQQGLSQNSVHCIFQDQNGLMWIGTQEGLNSFDGRIFTNYLSIESDTNTLSSNFILSIAEDEEGFLWIGTGKGFNRMDKRTGKVNRIYFNNQEKNKSFSSYEKLIYIGNNELLVSQGHENRIYNTKMLTYKMLDIPNSYIVGDSHRYLYALDEKNNFYIIDKNKKPLLIKKSIISGIDKTEKKKLATNGNYTVINIEGKKNKIYLWDNRKNVIEKIGDIPFKIFNIFIDKENQILLAGSDGLYIVKDQKITQKLHHLEEDPSSIAAGPVLCCYKDKDQNIWLGTSNSGVAFYNHNFQKFKKNKTGISKEAIQCAYEFNNKLYAGSASGLYYKAEDKLLKIKNFEEGRVNSICVDNKSNIWAAIEQKGLYIISEKGKEKKRINTSNSKLESNQVLYITKEKSDYILVCTEKGFYKINSTNFEIEKYINEDVKNFNYIMHVYVDEYGRYYLSTNSGLVILSSDLKLIKKLNSTSDSSFFSQTLISSSCKDKQNNLWVSTLQNGVYCVKENKKIHYTTQNGLKSNTVYKLECDNRDRVWAVTTAGLHLFDKKHNLFVELTELDGIPPSYYTFGSLQLVSNKLLVGASDGVYECNTAEFEYSIKQEQAIIKNIKLNGISIDKLESGIHIKPSQKSIEIELATKNQLQFKKIIYQYRLNKDENWITLPTGTNKLNYNNFYEGKSIIQVRAANAQSLLDKAPIFSFDINYDMPFWKTKWFLLISVLLLIGTIILINHWRNEQKTKKLKNEIEYKNKLQTERERIGRELHDNIGSYTSALMAKIQTLKTTNTNQEEIVYLNELATDIMTNVRETIWVLQSKEIDLISFFDRVKKYALRIKQAYNNTQIVFEENIIEKKILNPTEAVNLFRIIQEAIHNSFKHAACSEIKINITNTPELKIIVQDNGSGFDLKQKQDHYGLGNMEERAKEIGYNYEIKSSNNGTVVVIEE